MQEHAYPDRWGHQHFASQRGDLGAAAQRVVVFPFRRQAKSRAGQGEPSPSKQLYQMRGFGGGEHSQQQRTAAVRNPIATGSHKASSETNST
jgi:hypothetical protein